MADPEEYRTKEEVEEWRRRDPIEQFSKRLKEEKALSDKDIEKLDAEAVQAVDAAVEFADGSDFPDLDSLYDEIYVFGGDVPGWWTVDQRSPEIHPGEREREAGQVPHELAEKGAAYARVGETKSQQRRDEDGADDDESGEGEASGEERDEEGGAD